MILLFSLFKQTLLLNHFPIKERARLDNLPANLIRRLILRYLPQLAALSLSRAATAARRRDIRHPRSASSVLTTPRLILTRPGGLRALLVQTRRDLLGVALVVEAQQAAQHLAPRLFADGIACALPGLVEAMPQVQVAPAIRRRHSLVHLAVQFAQLHNILSLLAWIVEAVIRGGQSLLPRLHDGLAMLIVALADRFEAAGVEGEWEGLEAVGG